MALDRATIPMLLRSAMARGDLVRWGNGLWERFSAKTVGSVVCGDGTDVKSTPIGDVLIAALSLVRGDLIRMENAVVNRLAAKTSGNLVSGDGTDVVSQAPHLAFDGASGATSAHGDLWYRGATALARLAAGTSRYVFQANGAAAPSWVEYARGAIAQEAKTESSAVATGTTNLPFDDTAPTSSEGDEYMTVAITPKSASSVLLIIAQAYFANSSSGQSNGMALWDKTAGTLIHAITEFSSTADMTMAPLIVATVSAASTSARTYAVRIGRNNAGTITFNGNGSARKYSTTVKSSLRVLEIMG